MNEHQAHSVLGSVAGVAILWSFEEPVENLHREPLRLRPNRREDINNFIEPGGA